MYNFKFTCKRVDGKVVAKEFNWKKLTHKRLTDLLELLQTCYEAELEETNTGCKLYGNPQTSMYVLDHFLDEVDISKDFI